MKKVRIAILCSGGGTNFQAIYDAQEAGRIPHGEIVLLLSDHAEAFALERAKRAGLPTAVVDRKEVPDRALREQKMRSVLREYGAELIVLAGFLTILSPAFVSAYEGRILNIHPALLPSFGGEGFYGSHVHEAVLKAGVKVTGATVHYVTAEWDGGPIVAQKAVEVRADDTPESLQKRVMREAEWVIFPQAVEEVCRKLAGGQI